MKPWSNPLRKTRETETILNLARLFVCLLTSTLLLVFYSLDTFDLHIFTRLNIRMAESFRKGRVFLTGGTHSPLTSSRNTEIRFKDAGHIHSPTGGQGMNTGLQVGGVWRLFLASVNNYNLRFSRIPSILPGNLPLLQKVSPPRRYSTLSTKNAFQS